MRNLPQGQGTGLIETMFAVLISLIVLASLGSVIVQATLTSKNQGQELTRATIYAQDKMEALLALNFVNCTQSSGSQPASCNTTGISAPGWTQGLLAGGALAPVQPSCPTSGGSVGYVDYLDSAGVQMTGSSCTTLASSSGSNIPTPVYVRQWQVADLSSAGPALKQVTVAVYSLNQVNADWTRPLAVVTSVITN
jgi:type II secretory pathway pseudopilin PulG